MSTQVHKDVFVWRKGVLLASRVYALTETLADGPHQRLSNQMRGSALAIASSIAEGSRRTLRSDYLRCLDTARRAIARLETQICVGLELKLIRSDSSLHENIIELADLVSALALRLREHREKAAAFTPLEVRRADSQRPEPASPPQNPQPYSRPSTSDGSKTYLMS